MSKALSANIHDPNHTVDEYDLYFNGDPIETGGGVGEIAEFVEGTTTSFSNDDITSVRNSCFRNFTNLTEIHLPECVSVQDSAFYNCTGLTVLELPKVQTVEASTAFAYITCPVVLPMFTGSMFKRFTTYRGTALDFGKENYVVDANSFSDSNELKTIVLRSPTMAPLTNINAFSGTPFASNGAGGTLHVPQALISSYQAASNWSTIIGYENNQILPIEGSQYEHYYADGTPIE